MRTRVENLRSALQNLSHKKYRVRRELSILNGDGVQGKSIIVRKAEALALLLREMPIAIQDNELVVASRTMFGTMAFNREFLFENV